MANASGPLYYLELPEQQTLVLYEWERDELANHAKKLGFTFNTKPVMGYYDDYGKTWMVLLWELDHDRCPFLTQDSTCCVYEQRPMVCRVFPLYSDFFDPICSSKELIPGSEYPHPIAKGCPAIPETDVSGITALGKTSCFEVLKMLHANYQSSFKSGVQDAAIRNYFFQSVYKRCESKIIIHLHRGGKPKEGATEPILSYLTKLGLWEESETLGLIEAAKQDAEKWIEGFKKWGTA